MCFVCFVVQKKPMPRRPTALAAALLLATCAPAERPAALPSLAPGRFVFSADTGVTHTSGAVCLAGFADVLGRLHGGCAARRISRRGQALIVRDACRNPNGTLVETTVVFTGDLARRFTADTRIVITGPLPPVPPTRLLIRYERAAGTSACRPLTRTPSPAPPAPPPAARSETPAPARPGD